MDLDAVEYAIWTCRRQGIDELSDNPVLRRSVESDQYTFVAFT
ncbi:hypothetical protein Y013_25130 (plasmid) [Rhodococcus pyridinivorans SB3094]|uniref:Uncharacterized protein n=1 Tax=Rhodococcus pyridinivorans SB3094 TaxID=1435356 RepID=V9XLG2_9NOCA|nr:hypothetical protein Y013_25130 [Rhodococcus pyridinivorans SB3094]